eukprot:4774423-Pleurochrysis_carterae.AAC.1
MSFHQAEETGFGENVVLHQPTKEYNHGEIFVLATCVVELDNESRSKALAGLRAARGQHEQEETAVPFAVTRASHVEPSCIKWPN